MKTCRVVASTVSAYVTSLGVDSQISLLLFNRNPKCEVELSRLLHVPVAAMRELLMGSHLQLAANLILLALRRGVPEGAYIDLVIVVVVDDLRFLTLRGH
jgi:hypothetical protein